MASLTPGVLSKLLENAGKKDAKVTGEHRSPLLQVIEIVPSLAEDPWHSNGFFLKVSDSLHSAYVSISSEDVDLIYADKIQLGQFVYVGGLDEGSPVPLLRGLKPVSKRRPCVGNPTDLVSSDLLPIRASVDFSKGTRPKKANNLKPKRDGFHDSTKSKPTNEGLDMRRLSLDSSRKAWDHSPSKPRNAVQLPSSRLKSKQVLADRKAPSKNVSPSKSPSLSISPLKTKTVIFSPKSVGKPLKTDVKASSEEAIPSRLVKVPLSFKTWSEHKILWDALPPTIHNLGKEVVAHRNVAFLAAVRALEEASAAEAVIHCLQAFAELCESSPRVSAGPLVERFLDIHQSMQGAAIVVNSLLSRRLPEAKSNTNCSVQLLLPSMCKTFSSKNATSWVQAAIETDLSKFSLFRQPEKSEISNSEQCHYVIIENSAEELNSENNPPQSKKSPRNHYSLLPDSGAKRVPSPPRKHVNKMKVERDRWPGGSGLKEAVSLAEKLLLVSRQWFLKYLEDSLNKGFGLSRGEGSAEIACLLGQLKRVNQWLDDFVGSGVVADEKIEGMKKKLYCFLLEHVDSAVAGK